MCVNLVVFRALWNRLMMRDSVAIFRERFLWHRASESAKNHATSLMPSAAPIRPSSSGLFRTKPLHNSLPKMTWRCVARTCICSSFHYEQTPVCCSYRGLKIFHDFQRWRFWSFKSAINCVFAKRAAGCPFTKIGDVGKYCDVATFHNRRWRRI